MWDALLTPCGRLPRRPSQPSSPICLPGLRAKCQPALMQTQRTMGRTVPGLTGNDRWSRCYGKAGSNMTGPLGGGTDNHHGNLISFMVAHTPPPPLPFSLSVSEELAEVKWEYWRLSRDDNFHFKVDGIKLYPFHVATGERRGEVTLLF